MNAPAESDAKRCLAIREATKGGKYVSPADSRFAYRMWKKFPDWYASTEAGVFNATVPFGSQVRMEDPERVKAVPPATDAEAIANLNRASAALKRPL